MSLLLEWMEDFVKLEKADTPDGYGGYESAWTEGATFRAAATYDTSNEARVAAVMGVTGLYTITTSRAVALDFHDVVKRKSDGKVFRVTSDSKDKKTPLSAGLDMRVVNAEAYTLPR